MVFAHRTYRRRSDKELAPVKAEIARLFDEAERLGRAGKGELARRRVRAARRAAMKVQLRMGEHALRYCRSCDACLILGENATVRIRDGVRILRCGECGAVRRKVVKK